MSKVSSLAARAHDLLTLWTFVLAGFALVGFTGAFVLEVALRYIFNAPTIWSQEVVAVTLCASIFFALPMVTKRSEHVAITFLVEKAPERTRRMLLAVGVITGAIVILAIGYISFAENIRQFSQGIQTASSVPIPKWPISSMITYGLVSAGLHLLRGAFGRSQSDLKPY